MTRQLVPAQFVYQPAGTLVAAPSRDLFVVFQKRQTYQEGQRHIAEINRSRKAAKGPRRGAMQDNPGQTLACDVGVSLGMRKCKNWGS